MVDWKRYAPYITPEECMCKCGSCGVESAEEMNEDFLDTLLAIRLTVGHAFKFSSMYRCAFHPVEAAKDKPGTHFHGLAADMLAANDLAAEIAKAALNHKSVKGVRLHQKGEHGKRFVHIDIYDRGYFHLGSY